MTPLNDYQQFLKELADAAEELTAAEDKFKVLLEKSRCFNQPKENGK